MSVLSEFKDVVDETLHSQVFLNDPRLLDSNIYVNRDFSSTLHQLYLLKNWTKLRKVIDEDELWALLKIHEFRSSKLVFDGSNGALIADSTSQELYKKYYYNALWLSNPHINFQSLLVAVVILVIFYYILNLWQQQTNNDLLQILETATRIQQLPPTM